VGFGSGGTGLFLVDLELGVGLWLGVLLFLVDLLLEVEVFAEVSALVVDEFALDEDVFALAFFAG